MPDKLEDFFCSLDIKCQLRVRGVYLFRGFWPAHSFGLLHHYRAPHLPGRHLVSWSHHIRNLRRSASGECRLASRISWPWCHAAIDTVKHILAWGHENLRPHYSNGLTSIQLRNHYLVQVLRVQASLVKGLKGIAASCLSLPYPPESSLFRFIPWNRIP